MMASLQALVARFPRPLLFVVVGLVQVALIAWLVFDRAQVLRDGVEVTLKTRPFDPRDFLRGDYVVLNYEISEVQVGALKSQPAGGRRGPIYVKLAPDPEGFHAAVSAHTEPVPVTGREVLIRGRVVTGARCGTDRSVFCDTIRVEYGIERYFVPEGEGVAIEHARNEGKVAMVAAVAPGGRAAIKRLLVDAKPVYDEPWF